MKKSVLLTTSAFSLILGCAAHAETFGVVNQAALSYQSILSTISTSGGRGGLEWQVAPSHSELFGFGVRATVGGYLSDNLALGTIIDLGEHREEYLANAGLRLNDTMRVIGSFGLLKESEEFVLGSGRDDVSQLQYGLSLKGIYDAGVVRGFEINAYRTDASSDTDRVETGDLTGIQMMTQLQPAIGTNIRLGAGYEQVTWDGGIKDEGFTAQVLGLHQLSDTVALSLEAKSAETETVYGLGLGYDLSTSDVQNSHLSVTLTHIEGKHGISDDTRIAINWTVGLGGAAGAGSDTTLSSMGGMPSIARKDLLADVMTRPAFLPERVLAREADDVCDFTASNYQTSTSGTTLDTIVVAYLRDSENSPITDAETEALEAIIVSATISVNGIFASSYDGNQVFYSYPGIGFHLNPPIQNIEGETVQIVFSTSDSQTVCYEAIPVAVNLAG